MPHAKIHQPRIVLVAGIIQIAAALLVGATVFNVMERHAEELLNKTLQSSLLNRTQLTQAEIRSGFDRTVVVATRPLLIDLMHKAVNSGSDVAAARLTLVKSAQSFLATGMTAIALFDKDGREVAHAGSFAQKPALTVPLSLPGRAELMWDGQLLLHVVVDMTRDGYVVGKVVAQMQLPATTGVLNEASRLGETGELALCAPSGLNMQCFPSTLLPNVLTRSQSAPNGNLLPMAHALAGKTGFVITRDYRDQEVVAAYAPVGDLGLGMVLKMDRIELHAPVWEQLRYLIPLLAGALVIALLLLRWRLTPLVLRLVRSEAAAAQRTTALAEEIAERKHSEKLLHDSEAILSATINTALDGVVQIDSAGIITRWNNQAEEMFGWLRVEASGLKLHETIIPPQYREAHIRGMNHFLATGEGPILNKRIEISALHRDGHEFPIELSITPIKMADNYEFSAFLRDITERKQNEKKLELAASVFTHAREGIVITDAAGTIVDVNDTFTRITGYLHEEALGQNPRILKSDRQPPEFHAAMWSSLAENGHWSGEIWNRRKGGELFAAMQTVSAVRDASGTAQHYVSLFIEITAQKEQQQQLEHGAHYDALTNLPNRVLLADRLHQAMLQSHRRKQSLAVVYLDLDGFKQVNDKHGHGMGDEMLVLLSQHIKAALREGDTLARIGGDEFVAVLVDLEAPADCEPILARLLQVASQPVTVGDAVLHVSASIGVTLYPQDGADADLLLRQADQAMYIAKNSGKNRYHYFDVKSAAALQTQRESLQNIVHAMEQHEFVLHYQPKVNMKTGAVVGAEALIRWQHPVRGLLAPAAFLPIVEDNPLSVELGEWVIATAIGQMSAWYGQGMDLPVSVNIGAYQLQQPDFAERLGELLAVHPDIEPRCLQLEVLETSALQDMAHVGAVMQACKAIGVGFALDDFGTGYSSLTYLRRLPAETLKIDQSFVRDMLADPDDMAIVQGVIGLASVFRRGVIAEGVETHAHGELLLKMGCELAQGYGIARAMPATEIPPWVAKWQAGAVWTA